jgi:aspartate/methionine/tyrosine aminotransferase
MTGWRIGWLVVPEALVRPIKRLSQNFYISPPAISQVAALGAFDGIEELEAIKAATRESVPCCSKSCRAPLFLFSFQPAVDAARRLAHEASGPA